MNTAQTIFTIFYALYFAISITTTTELKLFDTTAMESGVKKYPKSYIRFVLGFVFINIAPLLYFWVVINWLEYIPGNLAYKNPWILFVVFIQSIVGFGFYRILFGVLLLTKNREYLFYDKALYPEKNPIEEIIDKRIAPQKDFWSHIIPGSVWIVITFFLLFGFVYLPYVK